MGLEELSSLNAGLESIKQVVLGLGKATIPIRSAPAAAAVEPEPVDLGGGRG